MEKILSGRILITLALTLAIASWAAQSPAANSPESTCVFCHSKMSDSMGEPVKLWEKSVHREVGTTCDACHGGDPKDASIAWMAHKSSPEMARKTGYLGKPSEEEVTEFCGKCHVEIRDNYFKSLHASMGMPNCVTCHTSHSVQRASIVKIREEVCSMCHENPNPDIVESLILSTRKSLDEVSGLYDRYKYYLTPKIEDGMKRAEAENATVGAMFHSFSLDKIKEQTHLLKDKIDHVAADIEQVELELKRRKWIGVGIIIFTLCTAIVLHFYRKITPIPHE